MEANDLTDEALGLTDVDEAIKTLNVTRLDPNNAWDKMVLDEAEVLSSWSGVPGVLARGVGRRTAARPCNVITIDRPQLERLFANITGEILKTARSSSPWLTSLVTARSSGTSVSI